MHVILPAGLALATTAVPSIGSPLLWTSFTIFVLAMLALDLGVFSRKPHEVHFKEALGWSAVWVTLALLFNGWIYLRFGSQKALEFLTGYVIEKALSVDNIFIFVVLFAAFAVPKIYQHRVLFWGVLGALIMRAIFIFAGAALLERFHWVMYVFGAILIITGIRLIAQRNHESHPENNPIFKAIRRFVPAVPDYHGKSFLVVQNGKRYATPLLLVLLAIEATDLVFAVDSIPAIFAITTDPFIVYTSNIFAILGLRALYFLLAGVIDRFHLLKIGLAVVLMFVGAKMVLADVYKVPVGVSLGVIALVLAGSIAASLIWPIRVSSAPLESTSDQPSGSSDPGAERLR
ncbi:MAG TPA: TerC family protein [Thermoanaerobaculia bacterium]|nr:TerC family protein [Thermoanaerobaculia bacterium]